MSNNFPNYLYTNPKYYESINFFGDCSEVYKIITSKNIDSYEIREDRIFVCAMTSKNLPAQGWKIHISANYENALPILELAVDILTQREVSFKVIRNVETYLLTSEKPFPREQYGKFITIYPKNDDEFLDLLYLLHSKLQCFDGPRILTDKRYKSSKVVHYRYGGFIPLCSYNSLGIPSYYIYDGNGNLFEDARHPFYVLPPGFVDIVEEEADTSPSSKLLQEYTIKSVMRFTNSGGTYIGVHKLSQQQVVIKEARPYTQIDKKGNSSISVRKTEAEVLRKCAASPLLPRIFDSFFDSEHYFIVEEYIEGQTLFKYVMDNNPFLRLQDSSISSNYIGQIVNFISQLYLFIISLRHEGYVMHDLTADNIIVTPQMKLKVIDMEGCTPLNNKELRIGKNNYVRNNQTDFPDFCELGLLLFSCIISKDFLLQQKKDTIESFMNYLTEFYTLPKELSELILALAKPTSESISAIPSLIDCLHTKLIDSAAVGKKAVVTFTLPDNSIVERVLYGIVETEKKVSGSIFPITPMIPNDLNIANGLAGIVSGFWKLGYTGFCEKFVHKVNCATYLPIGLYVGWGGCILTLLEIGEIELAQELYNNHCKNLENLDDFSLFSGVSGILIVALKLFCVTGKTSFLKDAEQLAALIFDRYNFKTNDNIGLGNGNAGIALALLHLYYLTDNRTYIEYGKVLLMRELQYAVKESHFISFPAKRGGKILYPYFMEGTAGILSVILRYLPIYNEFQNIAIELTEGIHYCFSVSASLFTGMAGIGNTLLDCALYLTNPKYYNWALEAAHFCLSHKIPYDNDTYLFPDIYCQKISVDYGYGSMGILLFLARLIEKNPTNFAMFDDLKPTNYQFE